MRQLFFIKQTMITVMEEFIHKEEEKNGVQVKEEGIYVYSECEYNNFYTCWGAFSL